MVQDFPHEQRMLNPEHSATSFGRTHHAQKKVLGASKSGPAKMGLGLRFRA